MRRDNFGRRGGSMDVDDIFGQFAGHDGSSLGDMLFGGRGAGRSGFAGRGGEMKSVGDVIEGMLRSALREASPDIPADLQKTITKPIVVDVKPLLDKEAGDRIVAQAQAEAFEERANELVEGILKMAKGHREQLEAQQEAHEECHGEYNRRINELDDENNDNNRHYRTMSDAVSRMDYALEEVIKRLQDGGDSDLIESLEQIRDIAADAANYVEWNRQRKIDENFEYPTPREERRRAAQAEAAAAAAVNDTDEAQQPVEDTTAENAEANQPAGSDEEIAESVVAGGGAEV